ncbi:uncharacterized protein VICG_01547 [Vittaforma corneae ATCC 50505]|uniref:Uncharacterized protein n=1 Tax=Vittaforma corneae (strain ATCC 50505) TaxID=993615 RepID=L2GMB1_VITCO|nr:uncharacterized protein VICG_01547 [Vittaforma corneae ATCC 50505]ELA41442.1 hypothetical protein VICG_01547 [Vittaforma corneae ATCC 50505]
MQDINRAVMLKMKYVEELLTKLENREAPSVTTLLKEEIDRLKQQILELKAKNEEKMVVGKEENGSRVRYYLKDGSVYVVKGREYRYLYDAKSKVVTYEFENGQIERTFQNGLKEIRKKDGTVVVKTGPKDFDYMG